MNKYLKIFLQILLYLLSISSLVLSTLFPNRILGIATITIIFILAVYTLWKNTSIKTLISSLSIILVLELMIIGGSDGYSYFNKFTLYLNNLVNWYLKLCLISTILFILIKKSITKSA